RKSDRVFSSGHDRRCSSDHIRGRLAGQQMKDRRRERKNIRARVRPCTLDLLQRRVPARITKHAPNTFDTRGRFLGQTKIEQHNVSPRSQLEVSRFDVAMYDRRVLRMKIIQPIQKLECPPDDLVPGKSTLTLKNLRKV